MTETTIDIRREPGTEQVYLCPECGMVRRMPVNWQRIINPGFLTAGPEWDGKLRCQNDHEPTEMAEMTCPCGKEHDGWTRGLGKIDYTEHRGVKAVARLVLRKGYVMPVTVAGSEKAWWVPRPYIAMHGMLANTLQAVAEQYGFPEHKIEEAPDDTR